MSVSPKSQQTAQARVVVLSDVVPYRQFIRETVTWNDICLELGCAEGKTTNIIAEQCGPENVIGVDRNNEPISKANTRYPKITFRQLEANDMKSLLRMYDDSDRKPNKIFVDINGCAPPWTVLPLIEKLEKVFTPEIIVIKNYRLQDLILRCEVRGENVMRRIKANPRFSGSGDSRPGGGWHTTPIVTATATSRPSLQEQEQEEMLTKRDDILKSREWTWSSFNKLLTGGALSFTMALFGVITANIIFPRREPEATPTGPD